jgi:hypothetical protein
MKKSSFYVRLVYTAGAVGLMSALSAHPLSAQGVGDIVRGLNNVINPSDAQRLENQERRNNRPAEERYWRDYRTGLDRPIGTVTPASVATTATVVSRHPGSMQATLAASARTRQ